MTNLRKIQSIPAAQVEIKDENGVGTGVLFEMAGPTHPKRKAITFAAARRAQSAFQQTGKFALDDPEEQAAQNTDNLAALTLGWKNFTDDSGAEIPFSQAEAAKLYADDGMAWLVDQLQAALNDKVRFMTRSATA